MMTAEEGLYYMELVAWLVLDLVHHVILFQSTVK